MAAEFGFTWKEVSKDGLPIAAKVPGVVGDGSDQGVARAVSAGIRYFSDVLPRLKPDLVVVLGDRYEIFAAASAAYMSRVPVAHIHGGETTQGAMDEAFRHSITKMSALHFAATEDYRQRIIRMGELPGRVFCFGAPGLDLLHEMDLASRDEVSERVGLPLSRGLALVTYHPATLDPVPVKDQVNALLRALDAMDLDMVFTKANADAGGRMINTLVARYCLARKRRAVLVDNLGSRMYWSCMAQADVMVGNSSSGIIEAPSLGLPVVNIGDRQKGRTRGANVVDAPCEYQAVLRAVKRAASAGFRSPLKGQKNPYDRFNDGRTGWRIKEELRRADLASLGMKIFFDAPDKRRKALWPSK
jgi:UDP-N-acetylglucosamine 2-epimerase (non-hydrolysing)/GDP/UDP-N,N'-diacetylbacillosamine 2-epimerase (hydrolysing)